MRYPLASMNDDLVCMYVCSSRVYKALSKGKSRQLALAYVCSSSAQCMGTVHVREEVIEKCAIREIGRANAPCSWVKKFYDLVAL